MMMRAIIVFVCFIIFIPNVYALSPEKNKEEQIISLESGNLEYNLGQLPMDKIIKKTVKIKNKLNQELKIKDARSSCDCMEVKLLPQIVKKNGIFEVEIVFDTTGISGDKESLVYILTDDANYELIRFEIFSNVK